MFQHKIFYKISVLTTFPIFSIFIEHHIKCHKINLFDFFKSLNKQHPCKYHFAVNHFFKTMYATNGHTAPPNMFTHYVISFYQLVSKQIKYFYTKSYFYMFYHATDFSTPRCTHYAIYNKTKRTYQLTDMLSLTVTYTGHYIVILNVVF